MSNLIAVSDLISQARKNGINLGSGDPYNRLRYYTKIGWLPHMTRKATKKGEVEGHYPYWVLERLQQIETLKKEGVSNTDINEKIKSLNKKKNLESFFSFLSTSSGKRNALIGAAFALLGIIVFSELGVLPVGNRSKLDMIGFSQSPTSFVPNNIIASGSAIFPRDTRIVFVRHSKIIPTSKIYVSFSGDYAPAVRYWVSDIVSQDGFYIELDAPTSQSTNFNWWATN